MELKLSNQEEDNVKSSGLKLSGESAPSTKTEKVEMDNPWDFDRGNEVKELKSIREQAINDIDAYTSNRTASLNDINIVVKIGKYVVYLCALVMIGAMIMICKKPQIDMYQSLTSMSSVFSFCEFLFILDAILVNVLYEKKISLIVWAILFPFVYPMMRDKHVDRGGIWGLLIFLGYIIAIGILVTNVVTAVNKYGSIVQNPNKEDRDAVVSFLETKMNSGDQTFGRKLENNISSLDFQVERKGSTTVIVVSGLGRYELGNDEITQYINNQVRTRLIFQKEGASNYQIVGVVTGERAIDGSNAEVFWNMYMH